MMSVQKFTSPILKVMQVFLVILYIKVPLSDIITALAKHKH